MSRNARKKFKRVAMGGTFDILHKGHDALLSHAFEIGDIVTIGVTGDDLLRKLSKEHPVRPYNDRVKGLRKFLEDRNWLDRAIIAKLRDKWGPTILDADMEAIVVTEDTRSSAEEINKLRDQKRLRPLHVEIVKMILAEDGKPITTTRIHRGEIDRQGKIMKRSPGP